MCVTQKRSTKFKINYQEIRIAKLNNNNTITGNQRKQIRQPPLTNKKTDKSCPICHLSLLYKIALILQLHTTLTSTTACKLRSLTTISRTTSGYRKYYKLILTRAF